MKRKISCITVVLDELTLLYPTVDNVMSFTLVPTALRDRVLPEKFTLSHITDKGFTHVRNEPMVQLSFLGDNQARDFSAGHSMKNARTCYDFRFREQVRREGAGETEIVTFFTNPRGQTFEHHVLKKSGVRAVECWNVLENAGDPVTVEMIASYSVTGISPFCAENPVEELFVHRFRSNWSAECKLESLSAADLQLEDSWSSFGIRQERIGQVGSMPCRRFMPFTAVEDRKAGCVWAVVLQAPMSWQMDVTHHQGCISMTGGIADYNYGHFRKRIGTGERFVTHSAYLTARTGDLEAACADLVDYQQTKLDLPASEESLPILFNDYCCTWGNPSLEKLKPYIEECGRLGLGAFVTDVGWWRQDERSWYTFGDWEAGRSLFPGGLGELSDLVRKNGMRAGIWFEFEGVSCDSNLFSEHPEFLLTRDGCPLAHGERSLLDFRLKDVRDYLYEKVIGTLKRNGFDYIKVDYNENIGMGVDGAESPGEGMRGHIELVLDFFRRIREEVPGIVLEVCSSGGMRLEPLFLSLAGMASFSDAHMGPEGAVIAASLHRYMPPRQMQIWAVFREEDSAETTWFTAAKGMLGRYCVSGDILSLSGEKRDILERSVRFYPAIVPILRDGRTLRVAAEGLNSLRLLKGRLFLLRMSRDGREALLYAFAFSQSDPRLAFSDPLLEGFRPAACFGSANAEVRGRSCEIVRKDAGELFGCIVHLKREDGERKGLEEER